MKSFLKYYIQLAKLQIMQFMEYRTDFFMALLGAYGFTFLNLIFISIIFDNFDRMGMWSKYQVMFYFGYVQIMFYTFHIFFGAVERIDEYIKDGVLDSFLVRPLNAFWTLITSHSNLIIVPPNLLLAFFIIYFSQAKLTFDTHLTWLLYILLPFGVYIFTLTRLSISLTAFWLSDTKPFVRLFDQVEESFSKFPLDVLPSAFQKILFVFVPVSIVGYIPVKLVFFGFDTKLLLAYFAVIILFTLFVYLLWKNGLRRYSSASS